MNRRKSVARLGHALTAGLLTQKVVCWTTPVVLSVALPAHAQGSPGRLLYSQIIIDQRIPAGESDPVDSLAGFEILACLSPGESVTVKVSTDSSELTVIVSGESGRLLVSSDLVVPVADIRRVTIEYLSGSDISVTHLAGAELQSQIDCATGVGPCRPISSIFCG